MIVKKQVFFLLGIFIFVLGLGLTSASFLGSLGKQNVCSMLNLTDSTCDNLWCEEVVGCNFSIEKEACICEVISNKSILENNESYYNKTEMDFILGNFSSFILNNTNSEEISLGNETKEYIDERLKNQTFSFDSKLRELETNIGDDEKSKSSSSGFDPVYIILIAIILIGGFIAFKGKGDDKKDSPYYQGLARASYPKIQSKKDLDKDEVIKEKTNEIEEIKKMIQGMNNPKKHEENFNPQYHPQNYAGVPQQNFSSPKGKSIDELQAELDALKTEINKNG